MPRKHAYFGGLIGASLVDASIPTIMAVVLKLVLDAAVSLDMDTVWMVSLALAGVIAAFAVLSPLFNYWFGSAVKRIMADIRLTVFGHMLRIPLSYFENTHSGDSMARLTNDMATVENAYTSSVRSILSLVFTGLYAAVIMFVMDWRFALALILLGLLSTYINAKFAIPLRKISNDIQKNAGLSTERLTDLLAGFQVMKMFQLREAITGKYRETAQRGADLTVAQSKTYAYLNSTNFLLIWINNGGTFIVGTLMLIEGQTSLGTLFSMVLLLEQVTNLFRNLGNLWANLQASLAGAARVIEILDTPVELEDPRNQQENQGNRQSGTGMVDIQDAVFGYKENRSVIEGVSLQVGKGQLAALVGPSGSGKSTLIKLLLGFYPLTSGQIVLDGRPMADYTLPELREMIAYVPQDAYLFEGTIRENIRYGRMTATEEEIVQAAIAAHAHGFIMEQPDQYDTMVGERGLRLSGGQKQRIAIARALLKNAPILLLDEATSALDSESEKAVQDALNNLMRGKTTIAIAHRISTIEHADIIYVIDSGGVAEQGRHHDLLRENGVYARFYQMQLHQPREDNTIPPLAAGAQ